MSAHDTCVCVQGINNEGHMYDSGMNNEVYMQLQVPADLLQILLTSTNTNTSTNTKRRTKMQTQIQKCK